MRRRGAGALRRWTLPAGLLLGCLGSTLNAQGSPGLRPIPDSTTAPQRRSVPAPIRYGKWLALGGAVGAAVIATQRHHDANVTFRTLERRCNSDPTGCALFQGHYFDPADEALYQRTLTLDHQAARDLIGAEVLVAASAAGFIWELMHHTAEPGNIPFAPRVEAGRAATRVGISVTF